ncbi:hypothetical protein ACINK0_12880 [Deinococcus sp. VB343]|uniref:Alpha/beta hydrolase n=1 Tax=Deinococcus sp. VB142 TaxID=3112952 RepID=A0AAU6Q280_9DEIO
MMMRRLLAPLLLLTLGLLPSCDVQPAPEPLPVEEEAPGLPAEMTATLGEDTRPGDAQPGVQASAPHCPTQLAAPYDTGRLSVGLYWYAPGVPEAPGGVGCLAQADGRAIPGYYDPAKPVLIFVHGWQPGLIAQGLVPGTTLSTRRENFWFGAGGLNVADLWLRSGWNIGFFHWSQLADDEHSLGMPFNAQAKIWTTTYGYGGNEQVGMRWKTAWGYSTEDMPRQPAGELFYEAYRSALSQWSYDGPETVRVMGHSLGAQMVLSLAEQAAHDPALPARLVPRRLILADPYWTPAVPRAGHHYDYLLPDPNPADRSARIASGLVRRGTVIEWLKSSPLLDLGGDNNPGLLSLLTRVDLSPDYLSGGQPLLGSLGEKHMVAPRWYLWSLRDAPHAPGSAARSLAEAAALMQERTVYRQRTGQATPFPDDDTFVDVRR